MILAFLIVIDLLNTLYVLLNKALNIKQTEVDLSGIVPERIFNIHKIRRAIIYWSLGKHFTKDFT